MSKRRLAAFGLLFILFLAQNFLNYLFPQNVPPILLVGLIYYSLKEGWRFGTVLGLFTGMLLELFGQGALGFYLIQMTVLGALSGWASFAIFPDGLLTEILFPVLGAYLSMLSEVIFTQVSTAGFASASCLVLAFRPWVLLGTPIFSLFLFSWLQRALSRRRNSWQL